MLYLLGWGGPQDLTQAYRLAKEAAEQGDQTGQFVLGVMFFPGNGVPQNAEESLKWMQASARQGYSAAQQFLQERGQNW
jgi:TPR repeat protein